jgi:peptidoglycan-N-acetylmuramic acid deacetylase
MRAEGHLVGSHTWGHPNQAELIAAEGVDSMVADMHRLEDAYLSLTGDRSLLSCPPQGAYSERTLKVLSDIGYRSVFWSFAYRDWITTEQPDPAAALQQIVSELHQARCICCMRYRKPRFHPVRLHRRSTCTGIPVRVAE